MLRTKAMRDEARRFLWLWTECALSADFGHPIGVICGICGSAFRAQRRFRPVSGALFGNVTWSSGVTCRAKAAARADLGAVLVVSTSSMARVLLACVVRRSALREMAMKKGSSPNTGDKPPRRARVVDGGPPRRRHRVKIPDKTPAPSHSTAMIAISPATRASYK